ncbi:MAG: hypothetical protein IKL33_00815 [Alphaproteobacteria bacterium]|nr:hypothetical protein [Alphaproteobacteria bacterium]
MRLLKFLLVAGCFAFGMFDVCQAQEAVEIGLQNPYDRTVVRCQGEDADAAEKCARDYENKGYVRFRDIPYKTAVYDMLKVDTYPTRRWRDTEVTPRW